MKNAEWYTHKQVLGNFRSNISSINSFFVILQGASVPWPVTLLKPEKMYPKYESFTVNSRCLFFRYGQLLLNMLWLWALLSYFCSLNFKSTSEKLLIDIMVKCPLMWHHHCINHLWWVLNVPRVDDFFT